MHFVVRAPAVARSVAAVGPSLLHHHSGAWTLCRAAAAAAAPALHRPVAALSTTAAGGGGADPAPAPAPDADVGYTVADVEVGEQAAADTTKRQGWFVKVCGSVALLLAKCGVGHCLFCMGRCVCWPVKDWGVCACV